MKNVLRLRFLLSLLASGLCREAVPAVVDHFTFSSVASPQRAGVPFPITVTARDSNNVLVTDFSAPVELLFSNAAVTALSSDFESGVGGWLVGDYAPVPLFDAALFDTDGDGLTNGAGKINFDPSHRGTLYRSVSLVAGVTYEVSVEFAMVNESDLAAGEHFVMDALYFTRPTGSSSQLALTVLGPVATHQVARTTVQAEYVAPDTDSFLLALRFYLEYPGTGLRVYVDNVRVRPRELTPIVLNLTQGQWTGDITLFRPGSNQMLRINDDAGRTGGSNPFDALENSDLSVTIPDPGLLPAGVPAQFSVTLSNAGPTTATGIRLTNELPADVQFLSVDAPAGCVVNGGTVVCDLPPLAPNGSAGITLHILKAQTGDATVRTSVNTPSFDPDVAGNTATRSLHFVPLLQGNDVVVTERPGGTNATFAFHLTAASTSEIVIACAVLPLTATEGSDYLPPLASSLVFAPGTTNLQFPVAILDDAFYEPPQAFQLALSVSADAPVLLEHPSFRGTILDDDPAPLLSLSLPAGALETAGTLSNAATVSLSAPLDGNLVVTLTSSDLSELVVPASITITQGQTSARFNLQVQDDNLLDGPQVVTVTAQVTNFLSAQSVMTILDNEPAVLGLQLLPMPATFIEGRGTVANAMRVFSAAPVATNVTVTLESSDLTELIVPTNVTITAGQSSANFPVTVVDDTETDGPQTVTITATAPGFSGASTNVVVRDNDVHHFTFGPIPARGGSVTSTVAFALSITAMDVAGNPVEFNAGQVPNPLHLAAIGDLGFVDFSPTNVTGFNGPTLFIGKATITNGFHTNVHILADDGHGHTGMSAAFTVYAPASQQTRIADVQRNTGNVQFQISTVSGRSYRVEAAEAPAGPWSTAAPNLTGTGGWLPWTDTNAPSFRRFYRIALQAGPGP